MIEVDASTTCRRHTSQHTLLKDKFPPVVVQAYMHLIRPVYMYEVFRALAAGMHKPVGCIGPHAAPVAAAPGRPQLDPERRTQGRMHDNLHVVRMILKL